MDFLFKQINAFTKKLFRKQLDKCEDSKEDQEDQDNTILSVEFQLNNESDIQIKFYWKELFPEDDYLEVKKMAANYAVLISLIDSGGFRNDIVKILGDAYKENTEENKLFISMVLENLLDFHKTKNNSLSKPLISPSQVFKSYAENK